MMGDLKKPGLMYLKAGLFVAIAVASSVLILIECPRWHIAVLLALVIWSAARVYYFMFYVIEKYIDPSYKFSGITSFVRYLLARRKT